MQWSIDKMFDLIIQQKASDIVFVPAASPVVWVSGMMQQIEAEPLTPEDIKTIFEPMLTPVQRERLDQTGDVDFAIGKSGVGRFRINVHRQRDSLSATLRYVPHEAIAFEKLKLPQRILQFADLPHGLVLVTGGTATGKSSTLAAMIEYINSTYAYHLVTLEDPIEFTFRHRKSIIEQREIGQDSPSFASALKHVVRQRPDVILVGEMRDLETISAALTAAEIGHLVLASLHTIDAVQTIGRIIDVFPAAQQMQIRVQLAGTLQGVVCHTLFHDQLDGGLVPAAEIMVATGAIRRAIRDNETHLLSGMIETGKALGMQTMDSSIAELAKAGRILPEQAIAAAHNTEKLSRLIA